MKWVNRTTPTHTVCSCKPDGQFSLSQEKINHNTFCPPSDWIQSPCAVLKKHPAASCRALSACQVHYVHWTCTHSTHIVENHRRKHFHCQCNTTAVILWWTVVIYSLCVCSLLLNMALLYSNFTTVQPEIHFQRRLLSEFVVTNCAGASDTVWPRNTSNIKELAVKLKEI